MIGAVVGTNAAAGLNLIDRIYPHHRNNAGVWEGSVLAVISSVRKIENRKGRRGGGEGVVYPLLWEKEGVERERGLLDGRRWKKEA